MESKDEHSPQACWIPPKWRQNESLPTILFSPRILSLEQADHIFLSHIPIFHHKSDKKWSVSIQRSDQQPKQIKANHEPLFNHHSQPLFNRDKHQSLIQHSLDGLRWSSIHLMDFFDLQEALINKMTLLPINLFKQDLFIFVKSFHLCKESL